MVVLSTSYNKDVAYFPIPSSHTMIPVKSKKEMENTWELK